MTDATAEQTALLVDVMCPIKINRNVGCNHLDFGDLWQLFVCLKGNLLFAINERTSLLYIACWSKTKNRVKDD